MISTRYTCDGCKTELTSTEEPIVLQIPSTGMKAVIAGYEIFEDFHFCGKPCLFAKLESLPKIKNVRLTYK